jgi:hypothetical protein
LPQSVKRDGNGDDAYTGSMDGGLVWQGAYVYGIDLESGFQLQGRISHIPQDTLDATSERLETANDVGRYWGYYYYGDDPQLYDSALWVNRILYIGDAYYTLSDSEIRATSAGTFETVGSVRFDESQ